MALLTGSIGAFDIAPAGAQSIALDPAFGESGGFTVDFDTLFDEAHAVAVAPDGRILVAGITTIGDQRVPAILRATSTGAPDPSFANGTSIVMVDGFGGNFTTLVLQPDGKILAGGTALGGGFIVRLLSDGSFDPTFGTSGVVTLANDNITALTVLPDGTIIAVGSFSGPQTNGDLMVVRVTSAGALDPTFGTNGRTSTDVRSTAMAASSDEANGVVIDGTGRILVAGRSTFAGFDASRSDVVLARYTPAGALDTTFGSNGLTVTDFGSFSENATAIEITADGKLVIGGFTDRRGYVARYTGAGVLDPTFGSSGVTTTEVASFAGMGSDPLELTADGGILLAGGVGNNSAVARFTSSGAPDATFDVGGVSQDNLTGLTERAEALAIQPDGNLVVAGIVWVDSSDPQFPDTDWLVERFAPGAHRVTAPPPAPPAPPASPSTSRSPGGYDLVASDGGVFAFGDASFHGSTGGMHLNQPIVAMAPTVGAGGYWLVARDGGVFAFGDARFFGSTGAIRLNQPIVGMARTPSGSGYWLVARDGGIFSFGDARFFGSTGAIRLNQPIVGMAATPSGNGYWLVASDGGIFAFGDAPFAGSTGAIRLNQPIVGMAATPSGNGYWMVARDGGIFAFGDAPFRGSTGGMHLNSPIVAMSPSRSGNGYWLVASDGGIFNFGDAPFFGSTGAIRLNQPIVTMAAT